MLKLVVLCAVVATVVAEPGALLASPFIAPFTYSSVVAPATTTITKQASSVVHPSPYHYSTPLTYTHFIKKRSAPLSLATSYYAPSTYIASTPYLTPGYTAPLLHSTYVIPAPLTYTNALHLIKKRSVGYALPSTYITPTTYAAAPLLTTYTGAHIPATPIVSTTPIIYQHLIKKRSAPLIARAYIAPTSYSTQSRVDIHSSPLLTSYSYAAPLTYSSPLFNPFYYKK